jgi:hypothetical protein
MLLLGQLALLLLTRAPTMEMRNITPMTPRTTTMRVKRLWTQRREYY